MGGARQRRLRRLGQATLEFAFCAPLFFLCFFAAIDAALWAIQTNAAVSAVDQAARLAAAAAVTPESESTPSSTALLAAVRSQLQSALFGTRVVAWCDASACAGTAQTEAACPADPATVEALYGPRTVAVCDETQAAPPPCPAPPASPAPRCGDPPTVTVHVIGYVASLVPPFANLGWRAGEIPLDVSATTHTLRFAT